MKQQTRDFSDTTHWNPYGAPFSATTTIYQSELYRDIAQKLHGKVADFGCGSAKLAAYLTDMPTITSYQGIECANSMVVEARQLIGKLPVSKFEITETTIEKFDIKQFFDCAVSTNSYYAWSDPTAALQVIYNSLKQGANFFLVTPNKNIDMQSLFKEAAKDLIMHPYYEEFKQKNMRFSVEMECNFVPMDTLLKQLYAVGFKINSCHSNYFAGGVNYVNAEK